ncbi:MAG: DUF2905 domain-containing protein [Candidatus Omnitrophica bacterium]|nr:DUF2905 domain-containing protein [Candidatus Omnitrophota bacterium]
MAKTFFLIGLMFMIMGCIALLVSKIPGLGRLPGDIVIKKENFTFYFPLATCLLVSVIISLIMYLINKR